MSGDTATSPEPTLVTLSPPRRGEPVRPDIDPARARARIHAAEAALLDERRLLTGDELAGLAALPDSYVTSLAALAHQVRLAWCGPEVEVEGILSAKTGGCPEDCHFCSQSSRFDTPVKATPFLDPDEVLRAAEETKAAGASEFCIVLAVRGPDERTMQRILELVPMVQERTGLNVAVSAGLLSDDQARRFAEGGVHRYNHNLETSRSFFPNVVTTHTWEERRGDLPARPRPRHGTVLRRPHRHGRDRRAAHRTAHPAPGARSDRGTAQLPQPPARHAARRRAAGGARGKPSAGSPSSGSASPVSSSAMPADARSPSANCSRWA